MSTTTPCTAFLQSHVGRLPSRAGTAMRLLPGTKIGAWRIVGGQLPGTRSDSYPIAHERHGVHAALTVFDTPAVALASYTRRILETAQILTALEHPGVASIVDAGLAADGRPYVVTEANRGMSLVDRIADETLDPVDAITILRGICEPLIAAHEMGVVHGGLTLEHVFLVDFDDSQIKLLDWGIERAVSDEARRAGIELPTRVYPLAPEAALGIVSAKIDAYAFGVIAYRLLLGRMPFEAETQVAVRLLQEQTLPDPRALWPAIPPMLETLLCELLAIDPRVRPSIRSAAERLMGIVHDLAGPPVVFVPVSATPATTTAKTLPLPYEPDPEVEWKSPFNWRIAAVLTATVASAALAIGVVQRADDLATMAAPRSRPVLEPSPVAAAPVAVADTVPDAVSSKLPAPPVVTAPRVVPPPKQPAAKAVIARAPVKAPAATRAAAVRQNPEPAAADPSSDLLTQYQRIGHDLIELRRAKPSEATTEMWHQFQALKIQPALARANTRASAAAILRDLRAKIERHKGVDVSDACRANPLAAGCT